MTERRYSEEQINLISNATIANQDVMQSIIRQLLGELREARESECPYLKEQKHHTEDCRRAGVKLLEDLQSQLQEVQEALSDAIKTAEFERHPFRPWHDKARKALKACGLTAAIGGK